MKKIAKILLTMKSQVDNNISPLLVYKKRTMKLSIFCKYLANIRRTLREQFIYILKILIHCFR